MRKSNRSRKIKSKKLQKHGKSRKNKKSRKTRNHQKKRIYRRRTKSLAKKNNKKGGFDENIKFVYFGPNKDEWDQEYINLILGFNEWEIDKNIFNPDKNTNFISKPFATVYIIHNKNDVVGYVSAETTNDVWPGISYNSRIYIGNVKIRDDFQSKHLCRPLVSKLLSKFNDLEIDKIFIQNESYTLDGTPACFCYYKAGIQNNYNMYYQTNENSEKANKQEDIVLKKMNDDFCLRDGKEIRSIYYYISKRIGERALIKLKRAISTLPK